MIATHRLQKIPAGLFLILTVMLLHQNAAAIPTTVNLGTASSFAVLAGAGITVTGPTTIRGNIGTFPTTTITGLGNVTLTGVNRGGDGVTQQAKNDLVTAYNDAAGRSANVSYAGGFDLVGLTLVPGVYNDTSSLFLSGTLTLDAQGNPDAVWIFQAGSTLITASGSKVALINGADSCNVFWQVGSSATLGTGSSFMGNILALTSITLTTGAMVDGRVLARNGSVTMDSNTTTDSTCDTDTGGGGTGVPDAGSTLLLLGAGLAPLVALRRRIACLEYAPQVISSNSAQAS